MQAASAPPLPALATAQARLFRHFLLRRRWATRRSASAFRSCGGYRPQDIEIVAGFDVDARKVGPPDRRRPCWPRRTAPRCSGTSWSDQTAPVHRGPDLDGVSAFMRNQPPALSFRDLRRAAPDPRSDRRNAESGAGRGADHLPAGRVYRGGRVLRRLRPARRLCAGQRHPGLPGVEPGLGQTVRRRGPADHRRRFQGAVRGDRGAPHAWRIWPICAASRSTGPIS